MPADCAETAEWITRTAEQRAAFRAQAEERQGVMVPSEDPDYEPEGEAWPSWPTRDRDAILQPPKPELRPSPAGDRARRRPRGRQVMTALGRVRDHLAEYGDYLVASSLVSCRSGVAFPPSGWPAPVRPATQTRPRRRCPGQVIGASSLASTPLHSVHAAGPQAHELVVPCHLPQPGQSTLFGSRRTSDVCQRPTFAIGLLGWKHSGGKNKLGWERVPNNADVDNRESLQLGAAMLESLSAHAGQELPPPPPSPGALLEEAVRDRPGARTGRPETARAIGRPGEALLLPTTASTSICCTSTSW